jgi:hypothetical protein
MSPSDINAPHSQPYQQPYSGVYSVPIGPQDYLTRQTSPCHSQPQTQSPIIPNGLACYPCVEHNCNALPSTRLLGHVAHAPPYKFPTAPAWPSCHNVDSTSTSPPHASPIYSGSSNHQEFVAGSHGSISSATPHSSTSTSPTAILTPHSDSTAYLSDQRSLSHSEPPSPLSPYIQHAPGYRHIPVSPRHSDLSTVVHQPATAYTGFPSNLPYARYNGAGVPMVDGTNAGRSPLLPIYNVAHDRSMSSSHDACHIPSYRYRRGIHFDPGLPPASSIPTDPAVTLGHPALTRPMDPYYGHRTQRCFGVCCSVEHDADDSDEPHSYAFIHNARETKKRPRRKFVSRCVMTPSLAKLDYQEEIVRNYACTWTGCAKAYGMQSPLALAWSLFGR